MSEINENDLNEEFLEEEMDDSDGALSEAIEEEMDDASVITVPIDTTLTHSSEAAEAKAVGDALALKADKSELQNAITVDGQSADNQGAIIVLAEHIPMSDDQGAESVKDAIDGLDARTGEDILFAEGGVKTIAGEVGDLEDTLEAGVEDTEIDDIFENWNDWEET